MEEELAPIHILPVNDIFPHVEEGTHCPCMPKIQTGQFDRDTGVETYYGTSIIIHNAWDKRK